jgi:hypothetical protein
MGRPWLCSIGVLAAWLAGCSSAAPERIPTEGSTSDSEAVRDASDEEAHDATLRASEGGSDTGGGPTSDATVDSADDSGNDCEVFGAPGECLDVATCHAVGGHTPYAGQCPGPASVECCIVTPSTANNPPVPVGWVLMMQSQVTAAMTSWAVMILDDPTSYPMFSTTLMTFGTLLVMARVEWHPPDFQNSAIHRGVTLYEPTD